MTTYTKETALYDTGAIAGDIQEAGAQVSKYITAIGDEGIKVHPYDATQGQADADNYAKIDSYGMEIWQKPEGASASFKVAEFVAGGSTIYDENGEQSARFGATTIIGNNDSSKIVFEKQRFSMSSDTGLEYFVSEFDGSTIETKEITKTISYRISTSDVSFARIPFPYGDLDISQEIGDLADGTAFTVNGRCTFSRSDYGDYPFPWTNFSFEFVKGTDETKTFTCSGTSGSNTVSCSLSLKYDYNSVSGKSNLRLTVTSYQKNHSTKYTFEFNYKNIKYETRTPVPTVSIMGATTFTRTLNCESNIEAAGEIHGTLALTTISITASTGTLQSATVYKQGNVVQLLVSVRKTSATASGQNVFEGTINTTELRPKILTTGGTYYGSYALNATISTDGVITIRNSDSRQLAAMTTNGNISFTYLID